MQASRNVVVSASVSARGVRPIARIRHRADERNNLAIDVPVLMLLRQNGNESDGWRGLPFWWPVVVTPKTQ